MGSSYKDKVVISVGGSLIVPNGGIGVPFLKNLNTFVRNELASNKDRQFFLICGGGATTRHYQKAAKDVVGELTRDDIDWIGLHATKLNAHLVRTILRDVAHPYIIKHYEIIRKVEEPVVVGAGWKPGWSTDYCSVLMCQDYGAREVINLSNVDQVYDDDPRKNSNAAPIDKMSWDELRKLVGNEWIPGMNAPFDPVAAKKAQELGIKVVVMNGNNFENLEKYFAGEPFVGTVIE